MIHLKSLLWESALTDVMRVKGVGRVTCKWDTGNTSKASALHATDIRRDGDQVTWRTDGRECTAKIVDTSQPRGKAERLVVELPVTWRGRTVNARLALTDRSINTATLLCNMNLMRQLGVSVNLTTGLE